jgi:hypothetical protein
LKHWLSSSFYEQAMLSNRYGSPYWQIATLAVMAALWIALSVPLVFGHGDAEAFLLSTFKHSYRAHPFVSLNPTFLQFWIAHSCLLIFGIVAVMVHKSDLFTVLIIGPTLTFGVSLFSLQWSDPDLLSFAGVCLIGWLVGIVAGGAYWFFARHVKQRDAMDSRQRRR